MVNVGIFGSGMATKSWYLPELLSRQNVVVRSACPGILDDEYIEILSAEGKNKPEFLFGKSAWETMLETNLDAVIIATPNRFHAPIALAAIEKNINVLIEKPACLNTEEGQTLLEAESSHSDIVVAVAFKHRYLPNRVKAKELFNKESFGSILRSSAIIGHSGPKNWSAKSDWFFDHSLAGGGCLIDLGPHALDDLFFITGDRVISIDDVSIEYNNEIDVDVFANFKSNHAAEIDLHTSWKFHKYRDSLEIICENGYIKLDETGNISWMINGRKNELVLIPPKNSAGVYRSIVCDKFISAASGAKDECDYPKLTDGVYGIAVVTAAYNAAKSKIPQLVEYPV